MVKVREPESWVDAVRSKLTKPQRTMLLDLTDSRDGMLLIRGTGEHRVADGLASKELAVVQRAHGCWKAHVTITPNGRFVARGLKR